MARLGTVESVLCLLVGCCVNNIVLEIIVKYDSGCGTLLTLLQMFFISIMSVYWKKPKTPFSFYFLLTFIFWGMGILNNVAFAYHISQPVHMVARSSSLVVSFLIGYLFFDEPSNIHKFGSVLAVTAGVFITVHAESQARSKNFETVSQGCNGVGCEPKLQAIVEDQNEVTFEWFLGLLMLFGTLCMSAVLGHLQAWGYKRWGKDVEEAQFYTHFFSLFYFITAIDNLKTHFVLWNNSEIIYAPYFESLGIPVIWFWVILNVITQYICICGVYSLVGNVGALTTTLLLTLRKFISLFISVWYFSNAFYYEHLVGALLVFSGCLWYQIYGDVKKVETKEEKPKQD